MKKKDKKKKFIMVSHDRYFRDRFNSEVFIISNNTIRREIHYENN